MAAVGEGSRHIRRRPIPIRGSPELYAAEGFALKKAGRASARFPAPIAESPARRTAPPAVRSATSRCACRLELLARVIPNPGLQLDAVMRVVRLTERGTVPEIIELLDGR